MKKTRWLVLLAVFALIAAACGSDDGEGTSTTSEGSTSTTADSGGTSTTVDGGTYCDDGSDAELVWAHEQEPPDLHLNDPNNNLSITSWIWQSMWDDLYGVSASIEFYPELLAEEAVVTENGDGSVTISHTLRDGLVWSDGDDLTSEDVKFTFDVIMEGVEADGSGGVYLIGSRSGYDQITDFNVVSDTQFEITYEPFFAGWKSLFTNVFPSHAFGEGAGAAEVNEALKTWTNANGETLPSSGPLVFESWNQGVAMHLVRNDSYNGSTSPDVTNTGVACVGGVTINWVLDTDAQVNALKAGEAHMIFTQPQLAFEEINSDDQFTVAASPGPTFEHWGFNLLNAHLAKPEVREALALALSKEQVVTTLYTPVFGDTLPSDGLGNTMWMTNQTPYENHQGDAGYGFGDVDAAKARLESAGYVLGADGIYEHPEDGRLSLRSGTTGGNALRELQQQIIQAQMKAAGIEITIDNVPGADYFSQVPFSGQNLLASASGGELGDASLYDITQFAWVGGPWPGGQSASYQSGSIGEDADGNPVAFTSNPYGFRNADLDELTAECDATVDDDARADCYNEVDRYVTTLELDPVQGLFMLPLTQKPQFFAYSNQLLAKGAIAPDANSAGPLANVVDYSVK